MLIFLHDVDEENVYRTCIGGSTRVPDVHHRGKIQYGADPRAVHDRVLDVDRLHRRTVAGAELKIQRMLPKTRPVRFPGGVQTWEGSRDNDLKLSCTW